MSPRTRRLPWQHCACMCAGARCEGESGSLSAFVVVIFPALFVLVGLVIDGGAAVAAQRAATAEVEQAARAGAGQLAASELRNGSVIVSPQGAVAAAEAYAARAGYIATVTVAGPTVTVRTTVHQPTVILSMVGIRWITVSAIASATDVHGVTRGD